MAPFGHRRAHGARARPATRRRADSSRCSATSRCCRCSASRRRSWDGCSTSSGSPHRIATSNGVNVTDGLDGLAAGACVFAIGSYSIIGFWQFNQSCAAENLSVVDRAACYDVARSVRPRRGLRVHRGRARSASCGGTRRPRRSSWATPAPWRSAARSPRSRSSAAPSCCCCSSAASSSSSRAR